MERQWIVIFYISIAATALAIPSDATTYSRRLKFLINRPSRSSISESMKKLQQEFHFSSVEPNAVSVDSPFSLPPFDSLAPFPLPVKSPPFCVNPPPSFPAPDISSHTPPPPPPSTSPSIVPMAPTAPLSPSPPKNMSSPSPSTGRPSPPHYYGPSPPGHVPGSPSHGSSPPVFLPPVVYPPPSGPPPAHGKPRTGSGTAAWCVAKPAVPDPIIQEALDYACGSGADCKSIQPSGHCYEPDTILAHASYAFNSYWQNTKVTGGTCDFGGTAMLVNVDPSFEGCKFVLN